METGHCRMVWGSLSKEAPYFHGCQRCEPAQRLALSIYDVPGLF